MLFRPFVLSNPEDPTDVVQSSRRTVAAQKTRAAAKNINAVLEQMLELEVVEFTSPAMYVRSLVVPII